jgi:DnaJ-domain-containing protein 1
MSLTRRFMNLARANLNALLDRVGDGDDPGSLDSLTDEELEAELLRRKARREREEELREQRAQAERAARARAAASGTSTGSSGAGTSGGATGTTGSGAGRTGSGAGSTGSGSAGSTGGRARGTSDPKRLAQYYAQLEVPFGADLAEVKAAYRRLMRKYHPDRYPNDPQKAAMATELTQKLAQAYREIEAALRGKPVPGKRM